MTSTATYEQPPLYNSELETATRTMVILNAAFPRALDLARLTWFDHLVVHTEDFGGPRSLHPALSGRTGELLVRRRLVEDSLALMRRLHLVETVADEKGISYRAGEDVPALVALLRTQYSLTLKSRAHWVMNEFGNLDQKDLAGRIVDRIGRWAVEFQGEISETRRSR